MERYGRRILRKYYSVGKTRAMRRVIHEFSQGLDEVFYEAWERLEIS